MNETITATGLPPAFPYHTQLPDEDGTFLTLPVLKQRGFLVLATHLKTSYRSGNT
ncbi:hypothetical protein [Microcoleus sp. AT3-D2]|uniref:hypothetical protein n=1 Tax=Microcoleus sp. AT3-D2 TaxID=2818612 RepID=UPI002FD1BE83